MRADTAKKITGDLFDLYVIVKDHVTYLNRIGHSDHTGAPRMISRGVFAVGARCLRDTLPTTNELHARYTEFARRMDKR